MVEVYCGWGVARREEEKREGRGGGRGGRGVKEGRTGDGRGRREEK